MRDLVEKYFKGDLTEAEQEALEQLLLKSEKAALKFEAMAKKAYFRYGLPEPQPRWKGRAWPVRKPWVAGMKSVVGWMVAGAAAASGLAVYHAARVFHPAPFFAPVLSPTPTPTAQATPTAVPPASSPKAPSAPPRKAVTPINLDLHPPLSYSNLSVVVGQSQKGFLTVRVLNPRREEVVVLYQGILEPGNWVFVWDGRLSGGQAAKPGFYQIEVHSGSFTQLKDIQIQ